jgi:cyanophycinase
MKESFLLLISLVLATTPPMPASDYKYIRIGNERDISTQAVSGYALMGGGSDLDEAFRFLCEKGRGGDFLILRAAGDDDYNSYVNSLCKMNSVATLIISSRETANEPRVAEIIEQAEAVFIAGGDQARYINWWQHSRVADALNAHIAAGKPLGGTSAGLAVMGEYIYSAQGDAPDDPDLRSDQALRDPYLGRVTVQRDFLKIDLLRNTLTDSHFVKRDRMGRSLVFLARIVQDGSSSNPHEIAVDEKSAVLVESDGRARVIGPGKGVYFMRVQGAPSKCIAGAPLSFHDIAVYHASSDARFDLKSWSGSGGVLYSLSVENGAISSTQARGATY